MVRALPRRKADKMTTEMSSARGPQTNNCASRSLFFPEPQQRMGPPWTDRDVCLTCLFILWPVLPVVFAFTGLTDRQIISSLNLAKRLLHPFLPKVFLISKGHNCALPYVQDCTASLSRICMNQVPITCATNSLAVCEHLFSWSDFQNIQNKYLQGNKFDTLLFCQMFTEKFLEFMSDINLTLQESGRSPLLFYFAKVFVTWPAQTQLNRSAVCTCESVIDKLNIICCMRQPRPLGEGGILLS